jgi:hypothetical protein
VIPLLAPGALFAFLLASPARADFSPPPESPYKPADPNRQEPPPTEEHAGRVEPWEPPAKPSTFRFNVGPAVLLQPAGPGLFTALDIGERAVGARLSGTWLRAESEQGLAAYSAELWLDLRHRYDLHPVLGAGASFLHGGALGQERNAGAGLLRVALEYQLPIADADARLSLNLVGLVPAIATERTRPWAIAGLMVGAGF